jgi:hypothetical protein
MSETHPLHRLFRGITESTFLEELGIGDPGLIGYVSSLLARFVPDQEVWKLRDAEGRPVRELGAMICQAESAGDDDRRREWHRHVGDFTLFWTGVFPEAIPRLRATMAAHLLDFSEQGKRSYYVASTCGGEEAPVLRRLSDEFDLCAFGLNRVRKEWERGDGLPGPAPRLIA